MMSSYNTKIGKEVEVSANGTIYRGILKGMTATEVYLKSPTKTWQIPMHRVVKIRLVEKKANVAHESPLHPGKFDEVTDPVGKK